MSQFNPRRLLAEVSPAVECRKSTFSAIKRKFGDAVRSKTDVACKNEVLAKIVAHNVVTCIHEMNELEIDLGFSRKVEEEPRIVQFPTVSRS